jgi:hypothetical protein
VLPQVLAAKQGKGRGGRRRHPGHAGERVQVQSSGIVREALPDRRPETAREAAAEEEMVRSLDGGKAYGAGAALGVFPCLHVNTQRI